MIRNKIKGSIYGVAVGDALGAPIEAERPSTIERRYGVLKDMHGSPSYEPGEFTDDTWLTLAACRAYETDTFNPERAGECMVIWMKTNGKGIGHMTNQALALISSGKETVFNAGKKALAGMGSGRGAGNGSLMRCVATGLAYPRGKIDNIIKESRVISEITHADKSCVASCIAYNIILSNIMSDEKYIDQCIESTAKFAETINQDTADIMMNALSGNLKFTVGEMTSTGYVLRAFERALTALLHGTSFEDEMIKVINEGGDADTNGAIAGGLLGAKYGYDAIPDRWIRDLKHKDELDEAVDIICQFRGMG